jgi:hypothetical protein
MGRQRHSGEGHAHELLAEEMIPELLGFISCDLVISGYPYIYRLTIKK